MPEELESLDNIPEEYRDMYVKTGDGKFQKRDFTAMETAMQRAKKERDSFREKVEGMEKKLQGFSKYQDIDLEEYEKMKAEREQAEQKKLEQEGNYEAMLAKHNERHQQERDALLARIENLEGVVKQEKRGTGLVQALAESGATKEGMDLLSLKLSPLIEVSEADGSWQKKIKDLDGGPLLDKEGNPGSELDLVERAKQAYPSLFKGTGASGSDTPASQSSGAVTGQSSPKEKLPREMTASEKAKYMSEHTQDEWLALVEKQQAVIRQERMRAG